MKKVRLGHLPSLVIASIGMLLANVFNGISIYFLRYITDYGLSGNLEGMMQVVKQLEIVLVFVFISEIGTVRLKAAYVKKSLIVMKDKYVSMLMDQDITQLQKDSIPKYRSNLINDFDRYEEKYLKALLNLISMTFQFLMSIVLMGLIDMRLVVGVLILMAFFVYMNKRSSKPVQKQEEKKSASLEVYTKFVEETLNGFEIIKQHQLEAKREQLFYEKAKKVQDDNYAVDVKSTQAAAFNTLVQNSLTFAAIIGGLLLARAYGASLGSVLVVASGFGNIMWPIQEISPVLTSMNGIKVLIDTFENNLQKPKMDRPLHVDTFEGLVFDHCDLGYEDMETPILSDVEIQIKEGEKVLIVGKSGAGKSTILKTLRQSIHPKKGMVILDQQDIFKIDAKDYYSLFSTIDQIGFVFTETVRNNVTLFQDISDETVKATLAQVGLGDLSLDEPLRNNGANLSGGQRARLMLARSLCLDSQVILCDEIFSSLPHDVAMGIENDILALDKTIINVSHIIFKEHLDRYDKIYIVENGTVRMATSIQEVWERMILSQENDPTSFETALEM